MLRHPRRFAVLFLCLGLPFISACGVRESKIDESGATLTGTITFQGAPLEFAQVTARQGDKNAQGVIGEDGKYKIENAPIGEVQIGVNTAAQQGAFTAKQMAAGAASADPNAPKKINMPKFVNVPEKFFDPATSGLKTTVQKGDNTYDIKIE
jgi:hypothetical protein